LRQLYEQIHIGHSRGNGTGRNIHQRPLEEAVKMADAIYAITCEGKSVKEALEILA
jgi:class I fructose-bisphosphate aldolase/fructose-bisphosphate aldolase/6-deoxy-5-ketofructose 1-phosphate synthase